MTAAVTQLVMDAHVHLYPEYDWRVAVRSLAANLGRSAQGPAVLLGLLTEGAGYGFFRGVRAAQERYRDGELALEPCRDPGAIAIRAGDRIAAYLIAGRQIITAERLEVLALGSDADIPDGEPVRRVIERVRQAGAVPVLSWAPGKWFFGRGRVVRQLLESAQPGAFLLGDTALRPKGWGYPALLELGRKRGCKVLCGSDPLPLPGEEGRIGGYGVKVRADFDPDMPAESVKRMLAYGNVFYTPAGTRLCPLRFGWKWFGNWRRKKKGGA